jgi:hypothetical protein
MPSPFPGMDPFLEDYGIWPAFHDLLVHALHKDLIAKLGDRYSVAVRERHYSVQSISSTGPQQIDRIEIYVEICESSSNKLVTVLDVASPANKTTDCGRQAYLRTHQIAISEKANVVEIDLLLQGQSTIPLNGPPRWDFAVIVRRPTHPDRYEIYTSTISARLPIFRVPLASDDRDNVVNLQTVFATTYHQGDFASQIDYQNVSTSGMKDAIRDYIRRLLHLNPESAVPNFAHDQIAVTAYYIWQAHGCPDGRAEEHWRMAIEKLKEE